MTAENPFPAPPLQADVPAENPVTGEAEGAQETGGGTEELQVAQPAPAEAEQPHVPPAVAAQLPQPEPVQAQAAPLQSASNVTSVLPPNAQAGAARAHAFLGHVINLAQRYQKDLERFVPPEFIEAAKVEVAALIKAVL